MNEYNFGYPSNCTKCKSFSGCEINLKVAPYYKEGNEIRLMLVGQDPTIRRNPERVKQVLMLDQPTGQLSRWLKGIFGARHAIDRASLHCLNIWQETQRDKEEGLHAWLVRLATEALQVDQRDDKGAYLHQGLRFVFEQDGIWPVLKTVMKAKIKKDRE
jgi:hypothetical protein